MILVKSPLLPLIDLPSAESILKNSLPEWEEMLEHFERSDGRLKFLPAFGNTITNLKLDRYPSLYENPTAVGVLAVQAVIPSEDLAAFELEVSGASEADRGKLIVEVIDGLRAWGDSIEPTDSPEAMAKARVEFEAMDAPTQKASIEFLQKLMLVVLIQFYEYLSIAVHGEKLSSLVAQAKTGDDKAFGKAIQIDGRILTVIPYFKERYARARLEDQEHFLEMVARKTSSPPYKGKIEHKALWMMFAFLDAAKLLGITKHAELLDLYNQCQPNAEKHIFDVKILSKRLAEYRRFQRRGVLSTP